jgi:hypothetical protein
MPITLFDAFCGFGGSLPGETARPSAEELLAEMSRLDIGRALVRIAPEDLDQDVAASNARLYAACAGRPELLPCPIVLPATGGDFPPEEEQVASHLARGCGAVWIRPGRLLVVGAWRRHAVRRAGHGCRCWCSNRWWCEWRRTPPPRRLAAVAGTPAARLPLLLRSPVSLARRACNPHLLERWS